MIASKPHSLLLQDFIKNYEEFLLGGEEYCRKKLVILKNTFYKTTPTMYLVFSFALHYTIQAKQN